MAPVQAQHPLASELIELDGDPSEDGMASSSTQNLLASQLPNLNQPILEPIQQALDSEAYKRCLAAVLMVFPDISHDHIQQLWLQSTWGALSGSDLSNQSLIERILDGGEYPKERDRLRELKKRKRASPEAEAAKWKYADLRHDPEEYAKVAQPRIAWAQNLAPESQIDYISSKSRLMERFDMVPSRFINEAFKQHSHYYGTYFAVDEADRAYDVSSANPPFQRLKSRRVASSKPEQIMTLLEAEGHDFAGLREEMQNADARWQKEENSRNTEKERRLAKEASDEECRRKGETIDCGCCFDSIVPTDMTHCNADTPHFFCFVCAKQNAQNDMTSLKYALRCMDQSCCEATFSRQERARFLDAATIDKLERLQQQDEIRRAEMGDLDSCPFCDYAAICLPPEVDRIFECQKPDCMEASCRLCRQKSHVPLSCEEFKKENGIGERHAIEEARTDALIRSCKKCKVRILKEDGCNKVICTNCYSAICDYCGEDISKTKYEHFDSDLRGTAAGNGKCPLYDASNRKEEQIEKAGKAAMDKIRKENPSLSEEDLKIKFAKVVQDQPRSHRGRPDVHFHHPRPPHRWMQLQNAEPPPPLPAGPPNRLLGLGQRMEDIRRLRVEMQQQVREGRRGQGEPGNLGIEVGIGMPLRHEAPQQHDMLAGHRNRAAALLPEQSAAWGGLPGFAPLAGPPRMGPPELQHYHQGAQIGPRPLQNTPFLPQNQMPQYQQEYGYPLQVHPPHQTRYNDLVLQNLNYGAPGPHPTYGAMMLPRQAFHEDVNFGMQNRPTIAPDGTNVPLQQGPAAAPHPNQHHHPPGPLPAAWEAAPLFMQNNNNPEFAAVGGLEDDPGPHFMDDHWIDFLADMEGNRNGNGNANGRPGRGGGGGGGDGSGDGSGFDGFEF